MANIGDENVVLGGHGLAVEFCIFCLALGACDCDLGRHEVRLEYQSFKPKLTLESM